MVIMIVMAVEALVELLLVIVLLLISVHLNKLACKQKYIDDGNNLFHKHLLR